MRLAIYAALFVLASGQAFAAIKCTTADGRTVYQDAPCPSGAKADPVDTRPNGLSPSQAGRFDLGEYGRALAAALDAAKAACGGGGLPVLPEVGWSEARFLQCSRLGVVGTYTVNETQVAGGVGRQYVFRNSDTYVYTNNGQVTGVQRQRLR